MYANNLLYFIIYFLVLQWYPVETSSIILLRCLVHMIGWQFNKTTEWLLSYNCVVSITLFLIIYNTGWQQRQNKMPCLPQFIRPPIEVGRNSCSRRIKTCTFSKCCSLTIRGNYILKHFFNKCFDFFTINVDCITWTPLMHRMLTWLSVIYIPAYIPKRDSSRLATVPCLEIASAV